MRLVFGIEYYIMFYESILAREGREGWKIKWNTGGGMCNYKSKEIWMGKRKRNISLFLHEVAHALCTKETCGTLWVECNNGHNVAWGDCYTKLVKKYMIIKDYKEWLKRLHYNYELQLTEAELRKIEKDKNDKKSGIILNKKY